MNIAVTMRLFWRLWYKFKLYLLMMKKKFKAFPSLTNILSGKMLSPKKLVKLGLLLMVAGMYGCNSSSNAQSASEKWVGEWQFKDPSGSGQSMKIILNSEGKAYFIPPESVSQDKVAYEIPLEKVSGEANLPADIKVVSLQDMLKKQAKKARQSEGRTYVGAMNRANQAYYLENNKFATNLQELQLGIKSESDNYIFKVVPQANQDKSVMNIAQAKTKGLQSYVGLVYLVETNNRESTTVTKLCETSQALSQPPKMPSIPKKSSEEIQCPSGFKSLR